MGNKGNMTEVEKRFNKEDLKAYKEFDNNQYSLIPGIQHWKEFFDRTKFKPRADVSFDEHKWRLEHYGYNRFYNPGAATGHSPEKLVNMSVPDVRMSMSKEMYNTPNKETALNVSPSPMQRQTTLVPNTLRTVGLNAINDPGTAMKMYSPKTNVMS